VPAALPGRGRRLRRHRRPAAALLLAVAAAVVVRSALPAPAGTAVVTAQRDLPAGHVVASSDLGTALLPHAAVPAGVLDQHDLVGARLASAVRAGEPLTDVRVSGAGLTAALPPGHVAVPVLLGPQVRPWLAVGQRLRLQAGVPSDGWVAPGGTAPAAGPVLASATVLDVAAAAQDGLLAAAGTGEAVAVLVQVPEGDASALAGAAGPVAAVLLGTGAGTG
jgi:hypothetical protein